MWGCHGAHHHHLILYVTEKKIWPGMVLPGRTRYYLLISGTKPPLERRLTMGHQPSPPAHPNFPTEPAWKQCPKNDRWQAWMGNRKKGSRIACCHTWQADSAAPCSTGSISSRWAATLHLHPLTEEMSIHKCNHEQQLPGLFYGAWQAAKCHFGSPFGLCKTGGAKLA